MKKLLTVILVNLLVLSATARGDQQLHHRERYILHAGDVISLNYRYTPEFNQTVTVQPDGYVTLTIVGDIKIAGLTMDEVHEQIVKKASARLNNPELDITLKDFQHPYVVVAGEVAQPGKIELRENTTALQAVMLAGGFKDSARDTKVILFRRVNGDMAEVRKLDLHNVHKTSDLERDTELQPGDMLLVTRNKMEHLSRFMKASNLGVYFNPFPTIP
jgi:polysaccharide export outer membrane protein